MAKLDQYRCDLCGLPFDSASGMVGVVIGTKKESDPSVGTTTSEKTKDVCAPCAKEIIAAHFEREL